MLKRRVAIQPSMFKPKTSVVPVNHEEEQQKRYQKHFDHLSELIRSLPNTCVYKAASQEVLDKVKYFKESCTWKFPNPMESAIETLTQTIDILSPLTAGSFIATPSPSRVLSLDETNVTIGYDEFDSDEEFETMEPMIISEAYLAQLQKYDEFGRSLKWKGGLQILGGAVGGLVSIILVGIYVALCALFPIVARTFGMVSHTVIVSLIVGGLFSGVLGSFSLVGSFGLVVNGVVNRGLANSMHGLMSKVNEHLNPTAPKVTEQMALTLATDPFERGLTLLDTNVDAAIACFSQVPETSNQFTTAQALIQTYTPNQSGVPNSPNKKSLFGLDPSCREREAKRSARQNKEGITEEVAPREGWRGARRRLGFNSPEYTQYLLDQNVDAEQCESGSKAITTGPQ